MTTTEETQQAARERRDSGTPPREARPSELGPKPCLQNQTTPPRQQPRSPPPQPPTTTTTRRRRPQTHSRCQCRASGGSGVNLGFRPEIQSNLQERFGFHTRVTDDSLDDGVLAPARAVPLIVLTDRHTAGPTLVLSPFLESPHQITS